MVMSGVAPPTVDAFRRVRRYTYNERPKVKHFSQNRFTAVLGPGVNGWKIRRVWGSRNPLKTVCCDAKATPLCLRNGARETREKTRKGMRGVGWEAHVT